MLASASYVHQEMVLFVAVSVFVFQYVYIACVPVGTLHTERDVPEMLLPLADPIVILDVWRVMLAPRYSSIFTDLFLIQTDKLFSCPHQTHLDSGWSNIEYLPDLSA
jgi:hypothetical protein